MAYCYLRFFGFVRSSLWPWRLRSSRLETARYDVLVLMVSSEARNCVCSAVQRLYRSGVIFNRGNQYPEGCFDAFDDGFRYLFLYLFCCYCSRKTM